jgi:drug/metabolite transporter (DMT)-like permease
MSLYPILIKNTRTDLLTQTLIRLVTTTLVCAPFITVSTMSVITHWSYHVVSILYLVHIISSYVGFLNLDVSVALTLFYLYPLVNVLINSAIMKRWDVSVIGYLIVSLGGVMLITRGGGSGGTQFPPDMMWGLIAMTVSIVTESLIYTFYKQSQEVNPFNMLFTLCVSGTLLLSLFYVIKRQPPVTPEVIRTIVIANLLFGVVGYLLRFYSLHQMTTEWFSILSFSGVIFGYLYGWFFYREPITWSKLAGSLLIIYSAYQVNSLGY